MTRVSEASTTTQPRSLTRPDGHDQGVLGVRWAFPTSMSQVTPARRERLLLGRANDCDVVLPGAEVSRHHAELIHRGPLWVVRDLNSRNGVYLNGKQIDQESLSSGDVLRIGEWHATAGSKPRWPMARYMKPWGTVLLQKLSPAQESCSPG